MKPKPAAATAAALALAFALAPAPCAGAPYLSEILAGNESGLADGDGGFEDWVEIANPDPGATDLAGWSLTDDPAEPRKWVFPEGPVSVLAADGHLVVFASGRDLRGSVDGAGNLHATFRLSLGGEYLGLFDPGGAVVSAFAPGFPPQVPDVSFGVPGGAAGGSPPAYLARPTPGEANAPATDPPGPALSAVGHAPGEPGGGEDIVVTATVGERLAPVDAVTLFHRVNYGAERAIPMRDNGTGGDAAAGDGVFTATLPAASLLGMNFGARDMVRYRLVAEDAAGNTTRDPPFLDRDGNNQSPEYYGTVVADPDIGGEIPVLQWFSENAAAGDTRGGTRASVFFQGEFYDNIFVRQRGQATAIGSQKFDFNRGHGVYVNEVLGRVGEINLNSNGSDPIYIRQVLAFDFFRRAGVEACESFNLALFRNGDFHRVGVFIEQVDEDFLDRYGLDPRGALYKFVQRSNLNPAFNDTVTGVEKKTRLEEDFADLDAFIAGLQDTGEEARRTLLFDHLNIPQVTNYLAAKTLIRDVDSVRKNFYFYHDTGGSGEWSMFPWDEDWTFGVANPGAFSDHPLLGDADHKLACCDQWNVLFDAFFNVDETRALYVRRLRTLMDELLLPPGTPPSEDIIAARADELAALLSPHRSVSANAVRTWQTSWRRNLYETFGPGGEGLIPEAQVEAPEVEFGRVDFNPGGGGSGDGGQGGEYFELVNREPAATDISGWTVSGAVDFTFPPGTVLTRRGTLLQPGLGVLFVARDRDGFRARSTPPHGGQGHLVVGDYAGQLSARGETLELRDAAGRLVHTVTYEGSPSAAQRTLRVAELHFAPAPPSPAERAARPGVLASDFEFVELVNTGAETLDLAGVGFADGVDFTFPAGAELAAGARAVIAADAAAFALRYGGDIELAGIYSGRFDNGGERVRLRDAGGENILQFSYQSGWLPPAAKAAGHALVARAEDTPFDGFDRVAAWAIGGVPGGTPGAPEAFFAQAYPAWLQGHFDPAEQEDPAVSAPGADPNGDGIPNLLHYASGTDPRAANVAPTHRMTQPELLLIPDPAGSGGDFELRYRRPRGALDLEFELQFSPTLAPWSADPGAGFSFNQPPADNGDGTETARATWQEPAGEPPERRGFFRLVVRLR